MSAQSARASLAFSCVGHAYAHLFEPIFYIVALVLPTELGMSYEETLALIIAGKLLYGVAAPVAGWLGDRWSTVGMMAVFFLGLGASAVAVGLAHTPWQIGAALAFMGLFGAIYHPVGIAWLVRNAVNKGQAIGLNGVFGGMGPAFAGLITAVLLARFDWRAAFLVPGAVVLATGVAFLAMVWRGVVVEAKTDRKPEPVASRGDTWRAAVILSITMLGGGLIYQCSQVALPKLFAESLNGAAVADVGRAVMVVYAIAGLLQVVAGHLADRYPGRRIYFAAYVAQVPCLWLAASATGMPLVAVAVVMVSFNMAGIPVENLLLAKYTPERWRGTAFGFKFVLTFGVAGLAVPLVSLMRQATGGFYWLLVLMAGLAAVVALAALQLPTEARKQTAPAPAE